MAKRKIQFWRQACCQRYMGMSFFLLAGCSASLPEEVKLDREIEIPQEESSSQLTPAEAISYHLISSKDSIRWLRALSAGDTLKALLVLNRVDRRFLLQLDTLVVPDTIGTGIDLYSPFPQTMDELREVRKILFISYFTQSFAVYENGIRIKWGPASLGKESTPTPTGLFATNWKSKKTTSTVNSDWVMEWYFNLANFRGVSMHQYSLPGFPASHACIRLYKEDAIWLYHWADQWILENSQISVYGTPVVIFGTFPFNRRKPWLLLADNKEAMKITSSALLKATHNFLPEIMERQAKRDSLEGIALVKS